MTPEHDSETIANLRAALREAEANAETFLRVLAAVVQRQPSRVLSVRNEEMGASDYLVLTETDNGLEISFNTPGALRQ